MGAEVERVCTGCGQVFWAPAGSTRGGRSNGRCPECQGDRDAGMALVRQSKEPQALLPGLKTDEELARELRPLLEAAHKPLMNLPKKTLFGPDPFCEASYKRRQAQAAAEDVIKRETAMLEKLAAIHVARAKAQTELVRAQNELIEAHLEQRRLKDAFLPQKAAAKAKPADDFADDDPDITYTAGRERRKARAKVLAEQAAITEFLNQVHRIFNNRKLELRERILRIRAVLDACGRGIDDLPTEVRLALVHVEDRGDER